jgi:hypothetical protein
MVQVRGLSSNRNQRAQGWRGGCAPNKMVHSDITTSNQLLDTLEEWNVLLNANSAYEPDI